MSPVVDGVVRVERSLSATPEQVWSTVVRMAHMGIPDDGVSLAAHDMGVQAMFDSLEAYLDN